MKRPMRPRPRRDRRAGGGYGRRTPPPERTGLESAYLDTVAEADRTLTVLLRSGETLSGSVEQFDHEVIAIRPADGPTVVVRKSDVRYLYE